MNLTVKQTLRLAGKIPVPGSKSESIRALFFALLAPGTSVIDHLLDAEDTKAALNVCEDLGGKGQIDQQRFTLQSSGFPFTATFPSIYTGDSGITTLFTLPLLGLRLNHEEAILLDCGEQMRSRPVQPLIEALHHLGMTIQYLDIEGKLPVSVTGRLHGGKAEIHGLNSQYLSALLISLPLAEKDSIITVHDLHERPYVDMTLAFLNQQHIQYRHEIRGSMDIFYIQGDQRYQPQHYTIQGDFSSASCLLAAAALIPSQITLQNLNHDSKQGDKRMLSILQEMGADLQFQTDEIAIRSFKPLNGIRIDANDIPDLIPALAVIGTQAQGKTEIYNVQQARIKETDRIHSMTEGLRKLGAKIDEHEDGMTIYQSHLRGTTVNGYRDHRTVMALTVAGMLAEGTTVISDADAIHKTYPQFVKDMQSLQANITVTEESDEKHIIIFGFKNVGKTLIGKRLATKLNKEFIDLDRCIEQRYEQLYQQSATCREIMQKHGEVFFRTLESKVFAHIILANSAAIIAVGGGTPLNAANQQLMKTQRLLHIVAPRGIVFERIMVSGRPAFFNPEEDPYDAFSRLWDERFHCYQQFNACQVNNSGSIEQTVNLALAHLTHQETCQNAA